MLDPFTDAWAEAFRDAINQSRAYRSAAARWTWPTALVVRPAPDRGLPDGRAAVLDLDRGECRSIRMVPPAEADAEFVLEGSYDAWEAVIRGELDPVSGLMRRRLSLTRGSLARLALHASAARALAACAADVPTRFAEATATVAPNRDAARATEQPKPKAAAAGQGAPASDRAARTQPERSNAETYRRLFRNAARLPWDPDAIDLDRDREDWAMIRAGYRDEEYAEQIHRLCSLFHEGEESVARTLSPFLGAMSRAGLGVDRELHLAAQVYEEARHYAFFERYFREVLGDADTARHMAPAPQAVLVDDLDEVAGRIRTEDDPERLRTLLVEGVTHYMGVVEAMLARTGYRGAAEALGERGWLPGLQEGFRLIRRDEGRHVAFGIHFIADATADDPDAAAIVERTFERHLPAVLETVAAFDVPAPLVDVAGLQEYALGAYRQFMAAAGLEEGETGELAAEARQA